MTFGGNKSLKSRWEIARHSRQRLKRRRGRRQEEKESGHAVKHSYGLSVHTNTVVKPQPRTLASSCFVVLLIVRCVDTTLSMKVDDSSGFSAANQEWSSVNASGKSSVAVPILCR